MESRCRHPCFAKFHWSNKRWIRKLTICDRVNGIKLTKIDDAGNSFYSCSNCNYSGCGRRIVFFAPKETALHYPSRHKQCQCVAMTTGWPMGGKVSDYGAANFIQHVLYLCWGAAITLDVAGALYFLHQRKPHYIIHRDISSANVLLWRQADQWEAKVSDYGAADFIQNALYVCWGAAITLDMAGALYIFAPKETTLHYPSVVYLATLPGNQSDCSISPTWPKWTNQRAEKN